MSVPTTPVRLTIEQFAVVNDRTEAQSIQITATGAFCYDEGEHFGLHYIVNAGGDLGRDLILEMLAMTDFPYEVVEA